MSSGALTVDKVLILLGAILVQLNLTVGGLCRTVTIRQIVHNQLDDLGLVGQLLQDKSFADV